MDDGVSIAGTLFVPERTPPPGGWPAIVVLHGFGGNRQQMNTLIEGYGPLEQSYAILTFDARGHGESGGLVGIDGPREVADMREIFDWLAARPDVSDTKIGAWGISYGGAAVLNSLVTSVPWAAIVAVQTWTDLYSALMPQGLVKSGVVAGLAGSIPEGKRDPSLEDVRVAALAGDDAVVRPWAVARSSLARLGSVTTPILIAPGRRDFLFGLDQATRAFQRLRGPKFLYVGLHGHAPSTFPAVDSPLLLARTSDWFSCYLVDPACEAAGRPQHVEIVPESFSGNSDVGVWKSTTLPRTRSVTFALPGVTTISRSRKAVRWTGRLAQPIEVFGTPTVKVSIRARGGWSRLVAVLVARTPRGKEIVVSTGGVPTTPGSRTTTIDLIAQATYVPRGSRLQVTLASSSTAQSPANLLYLDLPMRPSARARVGTAVLTLPVLRSRVTR